MTGDSEVMPCFARINALIFFTTQSACYKRLTVALKMIVDSTYGDVHP